MQDAFGSRSLVSAMVLVMVAGAEPARGQIVTDGSVGPQVRLSGGNIEVGANLGSRRGDNLFHSFRQFGIAAGQTATFTGPDNVRNVISRVTGGDTSRIDGTLRSTVGSAGFFFINPAGVAFGPQASVDVPGSFHASTADELRFADGTRYSAVDTAGSGLTVAAPESFGFLDRTRGPVSVEQSTLQLAPGKTFTLAGGDIDIAGGSGSFIGTEGGTVNLAAVAGPGQFRMADGNIEAANQGTIRLTNGAIVNTSGNGGGTVRIRGGALVAVQSIVAANNTGDRNATGGIDLKVGGADLNTSFLSTSTLGTGSSGALRVEAGDLTIRNGARVLSDTYGDGAAGMVAVRAGRLFVLGNGTGVTGITSSAEAGSTGSAGAMTVEARELELHGGGRIGSGTFARGNAGAVTVQADRLLAESGSSEFTTFIYSSAEVGSTGAAGRVTVTAKDLELRDGGQIFSSTFSQGNAGQVTVSTDHLLASGASVFGFPSAIVSSAERNSTGAAGTVKVEARDLELREGGQISSGTFGGGNAGQVSVSTDHLLVSGTSADGIPSAVAGSAEPGSTGRGGTVDVTARGDVRLQAGGRIFSDTAGTGDAGTVTVHADRVFASTEGTAKLTNISSMASQGSTGKAGAVTVAAREVDLRDGSQISSGTFAEGNAGEVVVQADHLIVAGGSGELATAVSSSAEAGSTGPAGGVRIEAKEVELRDGGQILSITFAGGNAGQVSVSTDHLLVSGVSVLGFPSAIAGSAEPGSTGKGGTVDVIARGEVQVQAGGRIFSDTSGTGDAGTVTVRADRVFASTEGTANPTNISSTANLGSAGKAGAVMVGAREVEITDGAIISSGTFGKREGGTVSVQADRLLIHGSDNATGGISTDTASDGNAGKLTVNVGKLTLRNNALISSSTLGRGNAGTVTITAGELEMHDSAFIISVTGNRGNAGTVEVVADRMLISGPSAAISTLSGFSSSIPNFALIRYGDAGNMLIKSNDLQLRNGGQINSDTFTNGQAGKINVQAERLIIAGDGSEDFTGISSTANRGSTGNAGTIGVTASDLELHEGGQILTGTFFRGNAGQVNVDADRVLVEGGSLIGSSTGRGSTGAGGAVQIRANNIQLQDGGVVTTASDGSGPGGAISIAATDSLELDRAGIQARTAIANGGDIRLAVGRLFDLKDSTVTTSVAGGKGSGGNIFLLPETIGAQTIGTTRFAVLNRSDIIAQAQEGNGGNITLAAGQLVKSFDSVIDASSELGLSGSIDIRAPNTDIASSLPLQLESFLDASRLLASSCAARAGQPASSLTAGGRGGLPPDPDQPVSVSPYITTPPGSQGDAAAPAAGHPVRTADAAGAIPLASTFGANCHGY
jgi:filamentous hemagglutinin family protein